MMAWDNKKTGWFGTFLPMNYVSGNHIWQEGTLWPLPVPILTVLILTLQCQQSFRGGADE